MYSISGPLHPQQHTFIIASVFVAVCEVTRSSLAARDWQGVSTYYMDSETIPVGERSRHGKCDRIFRQCRLVVLPVHVHSSGKDEVKDG